MELNLSADVLATVRTRAFGVYVHVPFCATRCGYCDFNTYTAGELGSSASPDSWLEGFKREIAAAGKIFSDSDCSRPADTIFVGGGTPSLIGAHMLGEVVSTIRTTFGLAPNAEVTTESNPESTSAEFFSDLKGAGFTRVSLGMQSAAEHVLKTLDRTHTPGCAVDAAREARAAGFDHINLDLIYGTPGERTRDLDASLDAVLEAGVDHVSAYALIVEEGTALARNVRKGIVPSPDDDVLAERYEHIDRRLSKAGLTWYEVSNWSSGGQAECHHNRGYWNGDNWWGAGPGAHSHIGGVRWWNTKHPARYAQQLEGGDLPVAGVEFLTPAEQHVEGIMLAVRMRDGLDLTALSERELHAANSCVTDGLATVVGSRMILTKRGRLLADGVVRRIVSAT
ncbi:coproporphyrinogen III oxidase [Hoyosella rhizosphaerae]|uniref:Heme chaperone HemW n=1 Tax=Hoyosella rhizosphaerae TaxID=1755582 RepID=A0A916UGM3_9ACTN|nr:radical SAM family heme chaperone HemW [Hoyosella rhizosphaerae]GGC71939.1 coproporphyrinogen III oxidase [Hoyosella rhizosphaerae]